ncbi:MAG: hypothetical protein WA630_16475 [Mycobacterium sp.]
MSASQRVRDNLLLKGLAKPLALNAIDWKIKQQNPSATRSEVQDETLEVVRSLVDDGLFKRGDVHLHRFFTWKRPLDRSMHKISHRYVDHYDDPKRWMYSAWFELTNKGEKLALALEEKGVDAFRDRDVAEVTQLRAGVAEPQLQRSVA